MSRAQNYLPSHCTGKERTHEKKEHEGTREVDRATCEKIRQQQIRERKGEQGSGSSHHSKKNIYNPPKMQIYCFTDVLSWYFDLSLPLSPTGGVGKCS